MGILEMASGVRNPANSKRSAGECPPFAEQLTESFRALAVTVIAKALTRLASVLEVREQYP